MPNSKGTTFRQHWAQIEKTLGRRPKGAPDEIALNPDVAYLWSTFSTLFNGSPLTFTEIKAYTELMKIELKPFEVEALKRLDRIVRA